MCSQDYGYSGEVYIPAPVVYKTVEEDDGVVVFANLWSFTYNPNGNTLDCEGGGEQPSRLKLKPDKKGVYTVQEHIEAADVVAKGNFSTGFAGCESSGWRRIFGIEVDESGKSTYTGSFSYGKGSGRRCPAGI